MIILNQIIIEQTKEPEKKEIIEETKEPEKKEEVKKLINKLKKIEILFDKKGNLIKEKKKINGKILMDNQLLRKND